MQDIQCSSKVVPHRWQRALLACLCAAGAFGIGEPLSHAQGYTPLRGFVDLHAHPVSNLGFGGKLLHGGVDVGARLTVDPDCNGDVLASSEALALGHARATHGNFDLFSNRCGDARQLRSPVIYALGQLLDGAQQSDDGTGYPDFAEWPVWNDITHQKMWVEWIRRAHRGGLRVMVALAVNNKVLGDLVSGGGAFSLPGNDGYATDDQSSADRQIEEIKAFVGRHPDFMGLALSSADIYQIVSAGKLAVVVGIEVDHIGNFPASWGLEPSPGADQITQVQAEIQRLHGKGVRYIFPIHLLDGAFGGAAAYEDAFNVANVVETGHPFDLACASPSEDITYKFLGIDPTDIFNPANLVLQLLLPRGLSAPLLPACTGHKNRLGLSPLGEVAIREMMRLRMLIDIDHMSQAAVDRALELATEASYPLNSGHNALRGALDTTHNERALSSTQIATLSQLHGMMGVGSAKLDSQQWLQLYQQIQAIAGADMGLGFGTDTNGLALGMPSRPSITSHGPEFADYEQCRMDCIENRECALSDSERPRSECLADCAADCSSQYPRAFLRDRRLQYSADFPRSSDGPSKTWDINANGVAHYGMLWDFVEELKLLDGMAPGDGARVVDQSLMNGAEHFFQTWRLAERGFAGGPPTCPGGGTCCETSPGGPQCTRCVTPPQVCQDPQPPTCPGGGTCCETSPGGTQCTRCVTPPRVCQESQPPTCPGGGTCCETNPEGTQCTLCVRPPRVCR